MITILQGDVREQLAKLPDASVQCCVTSPPYWGLRDYGVEGQIGLEPTPEAYAAKMVEVFREVRRVLREDGVCFLNLGDSYAGSGKGPAGNIGAQHDERNLWKVNGGVVSGNVPPGLKPKDLVGIPWRVAFALQADGWWLRQDIIWAKPNPMPESVTDRCTKAHEYIFLLTKSARYYWDAEAMSEPKECWRKRGAGRSKHNADRNDNGDMAHFANEDIERGTRNKRSVWTIVPTPYREAHFATFPPEIPRLCISAGSRPDDTVLDPFAGSGTTGQVANELGRNAVLIELKPEYCALIRKRCAMCEETEGTH